MKIRNTKTGKVIDITEYGSRSLLKAGWEKVEEIIGEAVPLVEIPREEVQLPGEEPSIEANEVIEEAEESADDNKPESKQVKSSRKSKRK